MKHSVLVRSVVSVALISASAFAHANGTHEQFVDPAASLSFDGWNELNRNRTGGALTVEELVAGSGSNVAGSGDAVFTRVSGDHYPAGNETKVRDYARSISGSKHMLNGVGMIFCDDKEVQSIAVQMRLQAESGGGACN